MTAFAELVAATNFSFLRGASHAHEMVGQAAELGLAAIGIADRNTLAGVVRAHTAAKEPASACWSARGSSPPTASRRPAIRRPRGLRPAVPPADARQPPRHQRPVPFLLRGDARRERGPDLHRPPAATDHAELCRAPERARRSRARPRLSRRRVRLSRRRAPPPRRARRARPRRRARRSSPPTTRSTTTPTAGRSRTCSPASARNARSPRPAIASRPTPSGI